MAAILRETMLVLIGGTSLSEGRFCTPDQQWPARLRSDMQASPECKGRVVFVNAAAGSQQSSYLKVQCERLAGLHFTHALLEGCTINDVAPLADAYGNPPAVVDETTQLANITDAVTALRAVNSDIVIIGQTMSNASADDAFRGDLPARYTAEVGMWEGLDVEPLQHHLEWPNPMPVELTWLSDGLHPKWASAFQTYAYPAILTRMRAEMGVFWP